jgi:molecular chaperone HscA
MLQDSLEHAKIDMESRLLVEAKNEAKQLVYVTERFVERNMILLNDEELQHINLLINDLNNSIESDDRNIILSLIDELNQFSTPFAQRLMDISISKALKGKVIGD